MRLLLLAAASRRAGADVEFHPALLPLRDEFGVRFATVMATANFIDEEHIDALLERLGEIRHTGYYARMGVAWAVSVCFVKCPQQTRPWLRSSPLDDWTHNKALQKIVESYRVSDTDKALVRTWKRPAK